MKLEILLEGAGHVEGPRVDQYSRLYFSDFCGGGVFRKSPEAAMETLISEREGVGGIVFNDVGGLVVTGSSVTVWNEAGGATRDLLSVSSDHAVVTFNDLTTDDEGCVYVGSIVRADSNSQNVNPGDLYRIDNNGKPSMIWEGSSLCSNGLAFSPDRTLLYHADSFAVIFAYDVRPGGKLTGRSLFAKMPQGNPDGVAVDAAGGLWVAAFGGGEVVRFESNGTVDQRIKMPVRGVTSLVFGGPDLEYLYVASAGSTEDRASGGGIYRFRSKVPGLLVPNAHII